MLERHSDFKSATSHCPPPHDLAPTDLAPTASRSRIGRRRPPVLRSLGRFRRDPLIRCEAVGKQFGQARAVDALSLDIYEGEFFCLLGPSGCGKTTLMRMIAGFETPSAGASRWTARTSRSCRRICGR